MDCLRVRANSGSLHIEGGGKGLRVSLSCCYDAVGRYVVHTHTLTGQNIKDTCSVHGID